MVLTLLIGANGELKDVTVREGAPPFSEVAVATVKTWRFSAATRDDVPVAARVTAVVGFHAPRAAPAVAAPPSPPPAGAPLERSAPSGTPPPAPEEVITVSVKGEHEELGTIHIPRTDTRLIPGAFGDPFRVVEALPGMSPWLSGLPYFYVRGMSPENVAYTIDGIRIPLLFHIGAGPSSFAPSLVDGVDLFSAAYPARYGRAAGAIIAGETTAPTLDHARGEFEARVFDASAFAELPYDAGKGTVLGAVRYGYTGPLISLVAPNYKLAYWDYQTRISHTIGAGDQLSLFVFGSYDDLEYLNSPTFHVQYHRADVRYDHPLSDGNLRVALTFSYDDTSTAVENNIGTGADSALRSEGVRLRAEYESHVSHSAWVRAGGDLGVSRFAIDRFANAPGGVGSYVENVFAPHTDPSGGVYADIVYRPTRAVELVPGFRLDAYDARGVSGVSPQPRLSAKLRLTHDVSLISDLGVAHQVPTEEVFVPAKAPNPIDESPRTSYQYSEALDVKLPLHMMTRATGYYTDVRANAIDAHQRSFGLELFLRRDFTERLGGFVSYTLSRSLVEYSGTSYLRAPGDRTHLLSVILGYDLGRHWRIGGRLFFESGRPYTCQQANCYSGLIAGPSSASGNLPAFFRIDARLEKRWEFASGRWLAGTLECFNVLNKAEPIDVYYASPLTMRSLTTDYQSSIILPSVGIEGGF